MHVWQTSKKDWYRSLYFFIIVLFIKKIIISSFVCARTLTGFSIAGIEAACFVMGMELVGPSKRTLAGILCWFFETTGEE